MTGERDEPCEDAAQLRAALRTAAQAMAFILERIEESHPDHHAMVEMVRRARERSEEG